MESSYSSISKSHGNGFLCQSQWIEEGGSGGGVGWVLGGGGGGGGMYACMKDTLKCWCTV